LSRSEQPAGVLIVDDDRHIRDILRELFLSSGYDARVAADGQEALEAFDAARPPLTVTDVHMPVMDGVELLKKARALDPDRERAAVRGVRVGVEAGGLLEGGALGAEAGAHQVRGAAVALDDAALAVDPGVVVRGGSGQRGVEELLAGAADVDGDGGVALPGQFDEEGAQRPRVVIGEVTERQAALLLFEFGDGGPVVAAHRVTAPPSRETTCPVIVTTDSARSASSALRASLPAAATTCVRP